VPYKDIVDVSDAVLNSYEFAAKLAGKATTSTTTIDATKQDELVKKLANDSDKYAAVLATCLVSDSATARDALNKFGSVQADEVLKSVLQLITNNTIPKGQLNSADVDELVAKILASRSE
jgi:ribosomal protein L9